MIKKLQDYSETELQKIKEELAINPNYLGFDLDFAKDINSILKKHGFTITYNVDTLLFKFKKEFEKELIHEEFPTEGLYNLTMYNIVNYERTQKFDKEIQDAQLFFDMFNMFIFEQRFLNEELGEWSLDKYPFKHKIIYNSLSYLFEKLKINLSESKTTEEEANYLFGEWDLAVKEILDKTEYVSEIIQSLEDNNDN